MGYFFNTLFVITVAVCVSTSESVQYLAHQNTSFYCDFPDIPVVWDFQSAIYSYHETLAFLDTSGRFYVDSDEKYKLEKWVPVQFIKNSPSAQTIACKIWLYYTATNLLRCYYCIVPLPTWYYFIIQWLTSWLSPCTVAHTSYIIIVTVPFYLCTWFVARIFKTGCFKSSNIRVYPMLIRLAFLSNSVTWPLLFWFQCIIEILSVY